MIIQFPNRGGAAKPETKAAEYQFPISAIDNLQFVVPIRVRVDGRVHKEKTNYWNDTPTVDYHADMKRGEQFATETIAAIHADFEDYRGHKLARVISSRRLELIFESMISDGIKRRKEGGPGSRTNLTAAMHGFLHRFARATHAALSGVADDL
jgi:hypothetical protein